MIENHLGLVALLLAFVLHPGEIAADLTRNPVAAKPASTVTEPYRTRTAAPDPAAVRMVVAPLSPEPGQPQLGSYLPLALAAADFDEDGIADLTVGLDDGERTSVVLLRGNADAIYPYSPEARERRRLGRLSQEPFLGPMAGVDTPVKPELLATGDFDNDGHRDVVLACRGGTALWLLAGDGRGRLQVPRRAELPGRLTALAVGEVGVDDGLADLVAAVQGADGTALLLWQDPRGAMNGELQPIPLPSAATALAVCPLETGIGSVVAATTDHLVIVHGRAAFTQAAGSALPLRIDHLPLPARALAVAPVFSGDGGRGVAVLLGDGSLRHLPAKALGDPAKQGQVELATVLERAWEPAEEKAILTTARLFGRSDLVLLSPRQSAVTVVALGSPQSNGAPGRVLLPEIEEPVAALSLRLGPAAHYQLVIAQGNRQQPLLVAKRQPGPTFTVNSNNDDDDDTIDGVCETAPGNGICTLRAAIAEANNASELPATISFAGMAAGDSTIYPTSPLTAISQQVVIDGTTHSDGMVEIDGTAAGQAHGLRLSGYYSKFCTIRGLSIHSFQGSGIWISPQANGNIIEGCHIGVDPAATASRGNGDHGVEVEAHGTLIGGAAAAARNVISGNLGCGVRLSKGINNSVQGSYLGTDVLGVASIGNNCGVSVSGRASEPRIGGTAAGEGNLLSGNLGTGISLGGSTTVIEGNLIGTDASGTQSLANGGFGIGSSGSPRIGGTAALAGNTISGNSSGGISITGSDSQDTLIQGNYIGIDAGGSIALANGGPGVLIDSASSGMQIGGPSTEARNVISGNSGNGLEIRNTNHSLILGNHIGTDGSSAIALGNQGHGISLQTASSTTIGGTGSGEPNRIAHNTGNGVAVVGGIFNTISGNQIWANGGLAIDLDDDGPGVNDTGDADGGTNLGMNHPLVSAATILLDGTLLVTYSVDVDPLNHDYDLGVELFAAPADGQGLTLLGTDTWTATDKAAGVKVTGLTPAGVSAGDSLAATVTDADGNTSELSPAILITALSIDIFADGFESGDTSRWSAAVGLASAPATAGSGARRRR